MIRHKVYRSLQLRYSYDDTVPGILGFSDQYRYLSNFWTMDEPFSMNGVAFDSSERAYMWHKNTSQGYRDLIMNASGPRQCKLIGRSCTLRPDWETIKFQVMYDVLMHKFNDIGLWTLLQATDQRYLEETNTWGDRIWGRCNGHGQNHLGRLLMVVREETK